MFEDTQSWFLERKKKWGLPLQLQDPLRRPVCKNLSWNSFSVYHAVVVFLTKNLMVKQNHIYFRRDGKIFLQHQYSKRQHIRNKCFSEENVTCQSSSQKIYFKETYCKPTCTFVHEHKHVNFNCDMKRVWYLSLSQLNNEMFVPFVTCSKSKARLVSSCILTVRKSNFCFFGGDSLLSPLDAKGELRSKEHNCHQLKKCWNFRGISTIEIFSLVMNLPLFHLK